MSDRRLTPANGRVAAAELEGRVAAERYVVGTHGAIAAPLADLRAAPAGLRDRQLLCGDRVRVLEERAGWCFVQAEKDGYCGYLEAGALGHDIAVTDMVVARATHLYPRPEVKAEPVATLPFASRLRIVSVAGAFAETAGGRYVPRPHLRPLGLPFRDPAAIAQLFHGAPYLWGGNSGWGIDCSGLVQLAHLACGIACPADTDLQEAALGDRVARGAPAERGDLLFWKGHVGVAVAEATLIHANAHHMAVACEPLDRAIRRIDAEGDGPVTAHRRPGGAH